MSFPGAAFLAAAQYPLAQGLEARPAIGLTFDQLQAMHVALNGTLRPNQREFGFDRIVVPFERLSEAAQFRVTGFFGLLEPGIQTVCLPLTEHARKFLDQFIRRWNLLICLTQLCQVLLLPLQALLFLQRDPMSDLGSRWRTLGDCLDSAFIGRIDLFELAPLLLLTKLRKEAGNRLV